MSEACPQCGTEMYSHETAGIFWCDTCELEYRRQHNGWFRTDVDGDTRFVGAGTHGESGGHEQ